MKYNKYLFIVATVSLLPIIVSASDINRPDTFRVEPHTKNEYTFPTSITKLSPEFYAIRVYDWRIGYFPPVFTGLITDHWTYEPTLLLPPYASNMNPKHLACVINTLPVIQSETLGKQFQYTRLRVPKGYPKEYLDKLLPHKQLHAHGNFLVFLIMKNNFPLISFKKNN